MQILAFMEENNLSTLSMAFAEDYTDRYPKVLGNKLGILLQTQTKTPLQEIPGIQNIFEHYTNSGNILSAYFSDSDILTMSGYALYALGNTRLGDKAPTDCPSGFIGVPGNPEFSTIGFCVSQYEMTYEDATVPNVNDTGWSGNWNAVDYTPGKKIISQAGTYPISNFSPTEAIDACESLGLGFHVVTNEEWMTIARSIEANPKNWSSGVIGQGIIYNGVSNNLGLGCNATGGNTEIGDHATKTGPGTDENCNKRKSLILLNNQKIWDFSGNLSELVLKGKTKSDYNSGRTQVGGTIIGFANWDNDGIYTNTDMYKYASAIGGGVAQGFGNVYYPWGDPNNLIFRGGSVYDQNNAGIYTLDLAYLTWEPGTSNIPLIGFRCAR